jgi:hypothetical protein
MFRQLLARTRSSLVNTSIKQLQQRRFLGGGGGHHEHHGGESYHGFHPPHVASWHKNAGETM